MRCFTSVRKRLLLNAHAARAVLTQISGLGPYPLSTAHGVPLVFRGVGAESRTGFQLGPFM